MLGLNTELEDLTDSLHQTNTSTKPNCLSRGGDPIIPLFTPQMALVPIQLTPYSQSTYLRITWSLDGISPQSDKFLCWPNSFSPNSICPLSLVVLFGASLFFNLEWPVWFLSLTGSTNPLCTWLESNHSWTPGGCWCTSTLVCHYHSSGSTPSTHSYVCLAQALLTPTDQAGSHTSFKCVPERALHHLSLSFLERTAPSFRKGALSLISSR